MSLKTDPSATEASKHTLKFPLVLIHFVIFLVQTHFSDAKLLNSSVFEGYNMQSLVDYDQKTFLKKYLTKSACIAF